VNLLLVTELETVLLQALRDEVGLYWPGTLLRYESPGSLTHGRNVIIGSHRVLVGLRSVGLSPRLYLVVKTPRTQAKTFRETRGGWFVVQNVAKYIVAELQREARLGQEEARIRQLHLTAHNMVQRLGALGLPEGCSIASSEVPGALDLVVEGLTEPAVRQTLEFLRTLLRKPSDSTLGLWAQLQSNDD
jgi:hypothetical protein